MRSALLLALVLLAAFGWYLHSAGAAAQRAAEARDALLLRQAALDGLAREVDLVGYGDVEALAHERDALSLRAASHLARLLEAPRAQAAAPEGDAARLEAPATDELTLARALADARLPSLAPGTPLHEQLSGIAALASGGDAGAQVADAVLARVVAALGLAQQARVEVLGLRGDGDTRPLPLLPELQVLLVDLTLVASPSDALAVLEALVPGEVAPLLSVAQASLRRVEPERWGDASRGMSAPPVRMSVVIEALWPAAERRP